MLSTDANSQKDSNMTKTKDLPSSSPTMDINSLTKDKDKDVVGSQQLKMGLGTSNSTTSTSSGERRSSDGNPNTDVAKLLNILPQTGQCVHTPCYCEENVWKLCDKVRSDFPKELDYCHVAFISNKKRMVPMWRQKAGKNEEKLALWDYHVILLYNPDDRCVVYDMDSELPFPTHFHRYVSETFRTENILQPEYHRFFRIIPACRFLTLFSSDRSHMLKPDRSWIKPPPSYPPICNNGVHNLEQFIDMTDPKNEFGEVYPLMELVRKFYKPRQLS